MESGFLHMQKQNWTQLGDPLVGTEVTGQTIPGIVCH